MFGELLALLLDAKIKKIYNQNRAPGLVRGLAFCCKILYIIVIVKAKTKKAKTTSKSVIKRAHRAVKLAIVPHEKNNYYPHLIRKYGIAVIVFLVIGIQIGYNLATAGTVLGVESNITITSLFDQTNEAREQAGVAPLALNEKLNKAAYLKAQDMITNQYWAHVSPSGVEPWKWFGDVKYDYSEAGENLAKGFYSTNAVMTAWMNSPEHKENIINANYQDVGFAILTGELDGKQTTLIVALYGQPAESLITNVANTFSEAKTVGQTNFLTQFAVALQSITPAGIAALALIAFTIVVSAFAHTKRHKLPKAIQQSWKKHHALYKAIGMASLGLVVIFFYGGGQI